MSTLLTLSSMELLINTAAEAAQNAGKIILSSLDSLDILAINEKKYNNFVTDIDKKSESEIIKTIHSTYPNHAIISKKNWQHGKHDYTWIINPLDGTTNFFHGYPHLCISIGINYKDKLRHGIIYDPIRQELFTATSKLGAFLNGNKIKMIKQKQLPNSLIGVGIGNKTKKDSDHYLKILPKFLNQEIDVRRTGSAALDCAYTACGRIDGYWGTNLSLWDMAAGAIMIEEAGGIVTDFEGKDNYLITGNMIAGDNIFAKNILSLQKAFL